MRPKECWTNYQKINLAEMETEKLKISDVIMVVLTIPVVYVLAITFLSL